MTQPIRGVGQVGPQLPIDRTVGRPGVQQPGRAQNASFKDTLADALGEVQGLQDGAGDAVEAFLRGDPVELHDVMAAVEEAGIALEMLIEVRNRFIEAYRTVANMQS